MVSFTQRHPIHVGSAIDAQGIGCRVGFRATVDTGENSFVTARNRILTVQL